MRTETLISVEEYLATSYRPDCEYVDGVLLERNLGEHDHSRLQGMLFTAFRQMEKMLGIYVLIEQRVQVSASRFRVPDLCVLRSRSTNRIVTQPPYLCIELIS